MHQLRDTYKKLLPVRDATHDADAKAKSQANIELGPAIPATMPGTMNIPEPIVPPIPKLTSSNNPSDILYARFY